ncbi:MAG: PorV/PorQ family protein [Rubricoccaceae bacterium]
MRTRLKRLALPRARAPMRLVRAGCLAAGLALGLAGLAPYAAHAQSRAAGFDLVRLDASPRTAALAGIPDALAALDASAAYDNPALLEPGLDRQAAFGYTNHVAGIAAGHVAYARAAPRLGGTLAAGVRFLSYGAFARAEADGAGEGTFGAGEQALTLAYARPLAENVSVGVSAHALFASIDDAQAAALTLGAGAVYTWPQQRLRVAASVQHVGAALASLGAERDRLPLEARLSVSRRLEYLPLTLAVSAYDLAGVGTGQAPDDSTGALRTALAHVAFGGELQLGPALALRGGYHPRRAEALRGGARLDFAGVSAGFGLSLRRLGVDYAFTGWSRYGGLHQFGVRTRL